MKKQRAYVRVNSILDCNLSSSSEMPIVVGKTGIIKIKSK